MFFSTLAADAPRFEFTDDPMVRMLLYFTIALLGAGLIVWFLVKKFNSDKLSDFKKTGIGVLIGYSLAVIVIMMYGEFSGDVGFGNFGSVVPLLFYPVLAILLIALVTGICIWIASLFNKNAIRYIAIGGGVAEVGAFIAVMVCMSKFYEMIKDDPDYAAATYIDFSTVNTTGLIATGVVFIIIIGVIYLLGSKRKDLNNTKALVYGAVSIAMSFALSYIRFFKLPQGGSITFASLLPLVVYCCMFGTRRGVIACLIYGVLQAIQDPFIIHPMQFLLDYPLAFGVIGISGLFVEKKAFKGNKVIGLLIGSLAAVILRYFCHASSGIFAFASYVGEGYSAVAWGFAYNAFVFMDMLIVMVAGAMLFASKTFVNQMNKSIASPQNDEIVLNDDDEEYEFSDADNTNEDIIIDAKNGQPEIKR